MSTKSDIQVLHSPHQLFLLLHKILFLLKIPCACSELILDLYLFNSDAQMEIWIYIVRITVNVFSLNKKQFSNSSYVCAKLSICSVHFVITYQFCKSVANFLIWILLLEYGLWNELTCEFPSIIQYMSTLRVRNKEY